MNDTLIHLTNIGINYGDTIRWNREYDKLTRAKPNRKAPACHLTTKSKAKSL